jgi:hypothetical protein
MSNMDERGTAYPVLTPVFYSGSSFLFFNFCFVCRRSVYCAHCCLYFCLLPLSDFSKVYLFTTSLVNKENTPYFNRGKLIPVVL